VVPYLSDRLRPAEALPRVEVEKLERLIRDLDEDAFAVRERATRELEALGSQAGPALRKALETPPSPEVRRRLKGLVDRLENGDLPPERLRALRSLRVLEELDTSETRRILKELAGGAADDALTQEAATVLARLARHPPADR
jgi:hypothetical protein